MAKDEVDSMFFAKVSDPIPTMHTLYTNNNISDVRFD
jgi:hypothetical protein